MFLKVIGILESNGYNNLTSTSITTLSISTSIDQIYQYFQLKEENEKKEELIEINNENDFIQIKVITNNKNLFINSSTLTSTHVDDPTLTTTTSTTTTTTTTTNENELGNLYIPVEDIYTNNNWIISTSTITIKINITIVERVPKNWFDNSLELLSSPRPWYFKAEDIYLLIKHILDEYKISTSYPVVEFIRLIDYVSISVGKNLLSLRLDEGFSLISQIDDALDSLLSTTDKTIDSKVLQLVLSLQQLRKSITRRIREISFYTQEKLYLLKSQASHYAESASQGFGLLDSAYIWTTVDEATNKVKNDILQRIQALRDAGRASIAAVQSQIYSRITSQVNDAQRSLFGIPAIAHPYVIGAVEATQPYINGALVTATPIIQTIREKTPVDTWINGTKEALERNETVGPYVVAATQALEEVKHYCTDQQYFEHHTTSITTTTTTAASDSSPVTTDTTTTIATTSPTSIPVEVVATVVSEN
mmetsp:Transcript_5060/g.5165  ORF Transcript_5060/g.5165 Transcript_5060/m.5165 type:complete len:478 (+) Transcript_5060:61-1494(+)